MDLLNYRLQGEKTVRKMMTVEGDLAKHVFDMIGCDDHSQAVCKKRLRRSRVLPYFPNLLACLAVARHAPAANIVTP